MAATWGRWRYALAGSAVTLLMALVAAALALWHEHGIEQRQARFMERYWDTCLSDLYLSSGSWEAAASRVERTLADVQRDAGGRIGLAVWDEDGKPVFAGGTAPDAGAGGMRPVLADGRIVGYFRATYDGSLRIPAWFWLALLAAVAAGGAGWAALAAHAQRSSLRPLRDISFRLDRLLERSGADKAPFPRNMMDKLARLEERLDLLERVRKTMVADIAHELRTPLSVVRAKLENALLRQESVPPEQVVLLHNEIYRVSKLIRDLNFLVQAEAGRLPLERDWFSLKELVERVAETMEPEMEEAGIALTLSGFDSPCRVYADRERLQQVFVNLLGNALRYARSRIEIACSRDDAYIHVAVRDDGIGIEEEDLPHVFDRFYRSPRASGTASHPSERGNAGRTEGLGLGLAIVKEFVRAHGGSVSVESRWNEGSVFTVTLPVFRE